LGKVSNKRYTAFRQKSRVLLLSKKALTRIFKKYLPHLATCWFAEAVLTDSQKEEKAQTDKKQAQ
jgi:hypothetical protein